MPKLEDIRIKEPTDLDNDEKNVLNESWDDLSEEERGTFKDIKVEEKPFAFKSQEEFDKAVTTKTEKVLEDKEKAKQEEEEAKKRPPEEEFFPKDYQAPDWNKAAKDMYPKFRDRMLKEQGETNKKRQDQIDKINKTFDEEVKELAKKENIPEDDTKARKTFSTELSKIGLEYTGVTNMTQAHKIWKVLKTEKKEEVPERQSDLASKIGRSSGEGTTVKERSHKELSGRSMDELIEEDSNKLGVKG